MTFTNVLTYGYGHSIVKGKREKGPNESFVLVSHLLGNLVIASVIRVI
jgi:hypothetical protein